ncbi:serine-threonine/tyrosine-protein kinase catalytic domain-containing protein [Tanacetum coccineum]
MVAVKRLNEQFGQGLKEFFTEIQLLSGQRHPNLVSLVGYCDEGKEKTIVYEYAERGSLDQYIRRSGKSTSTTLMWLQRLKICADAARGKSKKSKKGVFSIYMQYDGIFITSPLSYAEGSRGVRGGGRGVRGGGRGGRGGGRGGTTTSDREFMKEESRKEEEYVRRCREEEEWEARMDWTHPMHCTEGSNEGSRDGEQFLAQNNPAQATQQSVIHAEPDEPMDQTTNEDVATVDNGKGKAVDEATDVTTQPSKKRNRQKWQEQAYVDGVGIYVKNSGTSERIANRRNKFENLGPGSTPEKALDVSSTEIQYRDKNNIKKGSKYVNVEYAWKPEICSHCHVFGHSYGNCTKRERTAEEIALDSKRKEEAIRRRNEENRERNNNGNFRGNWKFGEKK